MSTCRVQNFFKDQTVLVTGATGFLGKVIVEKLLRSCPEVKNVFLIIRPENGGNTSIQNRLELLLNSTVFDRIKKCDPTILSKIHVILGDMELPSLGLSETDLQLIKKSVTTVIHSAATVRFDEPLFKALELNTNGTRKLLKICKEMSQLKSFVHVSTAYSNCHHSFIEEKVYDAPVGSSEIKSFLKGDTSVGDLNHELLTKVGKSRPNTYIYSKALAENIVAEEAKNLPACIIRPSIVSASIFEPTPGWTDNVNGPTGIISGVGLGALRVVAADPAKSINIVPVDVVANLILCAAWSASLKGHLSTANDTVPVYNCCSSENNPLMYKQFQTELNSFLNYDSPFSKAARCPNIRVVPNKLNLFMSNLFFQLLPALFHDYVLPSSKFSALSVYRKLNRLTKTLSHFTINEWQFATNNSKNLLNKLTTEEKENFFFDVHEINWESYIKSYCRGVRRFIMREDDSTIQNAKDHIKRLSTIEIFTGASFLCLGAFLLILLATNFNLFAFSLINKKKAIYG